MVQLTRFENLRVKSLGRRTLWVILCLHIFFLIVGLIRTSGSRINYRLCLRS